MTVRSPSEVYQYLIGAGFNPSSATTMVAIAQAESSLRDDARGDLGIQTSIWGPSYGLFQIRTLKQQTGTGQDRDIASLVDPARQAAAAYRISDGGTDFSPWSTYTNGSYRQFLGTAIDSGTVNQSVSLNPLDWPTDVKNWITQQEQNAVESAKKIALEGMFIVLGLGLVGFGLVRAVTGTQKYQETKKKAEKGATAAAMVAAPEAAPAIGAASAAKEQKEAKKNA